MGLKIVFFIGLNYLQEESVKMGHKFDMIYIEGPGDVVESFRHWHSKEDVITETSRTFSGQFFDFCRRNKLNTYAVSYCKQMKKEVTDGFYVENRPKLVLNMETGILYHLTQILYGLWIVYIAIRYRPKYLSVTSGVTYWIILSPVKLLGIQIIPQLHNTLWPKGYRPKTLMKRALLALDGLFFRYIATKILCVSPEIKRQIERVSRERRDNIFLFYAQFYRKDFDGIPTIPHNERPFKIVFVGRVERNKGVFDLLDIAEQLREDDVIFDVCGGGAALSELKRLSKIRGLNEIITIHGQLERPQLLTIYAQAQAVIVPTRSDFCEGMPQVIAESILLGRPVITSKLSNALDVVGNAIIEAEPDDVQSYVQAIRRLIYDPVYYESLCINCSPLKEQFLDGKKGLGDVLQYIV